MLAIAILNVFKSIAVAIGAGATTVLTAQSLAAAKDGTVSADEQRLLMVIMVVMRVAILLFFLAHALFTAIIYSIYGADIYLFQTFMDIQSLTWSLIALLFIIFVFIDKRIITRQVGVTISLTAWYALVFLLAWPDGLSVQLSNFVFAYTIFVATAVVLVQRSHLFTGHTHTIPRNSEGG